MLKYRIIIGTVLVIGLLGLFLLDDYLARETGVAWAPVFFTVVGLVAVGAVYEMSLLLRRRGWRIYEMPALAAVLAMLSLAAVCHATGVRLLFHIGPMTIGPALIVLVLLVMALLVAEVARNWRTDGIDVAIQSIGATVLIVLYVGVLLAFVIAIRFLRQPAGLGCLLTWIAAVKAGDIGAYIAGRALGRHKLIPRLSPGKTVEGCLGGFVLGLAVALAIGRPLLALPWWQLLVFGVAVTVFGMLGDLAESLIKRASEAKDSSSMVPGYGGLLDVIDSLLLSAPVAYGLLMLFGAR